MSNNNSHPEECIGIINNLTTQITNLTETIEYYLLNSSSYHFAENDTSFMETSQQENCTIEWINMTLGITGLVLLLGMPVGYAVYKYCGAKELKCLGNDGMSDHMNNYE